MPINLVAFSPAQVAAANKKPKAPSSAGNKTKTVRKKVSQTTTIYGEELFQESIRKEREITMHFSDFNSFGLRFSDDGEFILGYKFVDYDNSVFTLYHCLDKVPFELLLENLEESDRVLKYVYNNLREAADKLFSIVREQFAEEKAQKIVDQAATDKLNFDLEQERKEKFEEELEKEFAAQETGSIELVSAPEMEVEVVEEVKTPLFFKRIVETVTETEETVVEENKPKQFFVYRRPDANS